MLTTSACFALQARSDPNFVVRSNVSVQAFTNVLEDVNGEYLPAMSSFVGGDDGYHPNACLAVDHDLANTESGHGPMATMLWRPFVAFKSNNYNYVTSQGRKCIVQVGVSFNSTPHFGREQEEGGPALDRSPNL